MLGAVTRVYVSVVLVTIVADNRDGVDEENVALCMQIVVA